MDGRSNRGWSFWLALWAGKLAAAGLKLVGKNATTLPGFIANRLDPQVIKHLCRGYTDGIVIVTGTNGKTTTANLLANILRVAGKGFAFNQAGANLVTGISGALLANTGWLGAPRARLALFEVDEATVPKVCQDLTPRLAVITNFFRDQLDRYGELDTTVRLVKQAIPRETTMVLNADDPLVAQFGMERTNAVYYGVASTPDSKTENREAREARFCPMCGNPLDYQLFHYGQLGVFSCPACSFRRPQPQVLAENVASAAGGTRFEVESELIVLALQGYYNLYNALAALSAARQLGVAWQYVEQGLREYIAQAGRMERLVLPEGAVTLTLVKNPTGFNQVISAVLAGDKPISLLIGINDLAADGRDISWLWDVDFERLGEEAGRIRRIVCCGLRAEDMAVRLKYAGVPVDRLVVVGQLAPALAAVQQGRGEDEEVFALPTYTLLFPLRGILAGRAGKGLVPAVLREEVGT